MVFHDHHLRRSPEKQRRAQKGVLLGWTFFNQDGVILCDPRTHGTVIDPLPLKLKDCECRSSR